MKRNKIKLGSGLASALAAAVLLAASHLPAHAQGEVKSTDLTAALKVFVDNMGAAQAAEQDADSKASQLLKSAQADEAQSQNTNLPPQARFDSHAKVIETQTDAVRIKLQAARQSAKLLSAAKEALRNVSSDLGRNLPPELKNLPTPEEQAKVDDSIGNLNLPPDAAVEPESAEALGAARTYYEMACNGAAQGSAGSATLQTVARRLTAWESKNRQAIVWYDATLKRLELAAVSGLAAVGNFTLDQALGGSQSALDRGLMTVSMAPLAPTIAANGETPAAGPAKVSFRRALSH